MNSREVPAEPTRYAPSPGLTGTIISGRYGFVTVDARGPTVKVTFYRDADGDGHYNDILESFFVSSPKGGEEVVRGNTAVAPPASMLDRRGRLMPSF